MAQKAKRPYVKISLSLDEEERMISFVKQHPEIYDPKNADYKNKAHKDMIWSDFAKTLNNDGITGRTLKKIILMIVFSVCTS